MPTLVGVYAPAEAEREGAALFRELTRDLGSAASSLHEGSLHAAVFPQHEGECIVCPDAPGALGPAIGFGGDDRKTPAARLVPPWLFCRWDAARRVAVVETDRHGFALVYVRTVGACVVFSTSAARLGRLAPRSSLDPHALAELLAFDHLLGERTLRREVTAVPQGAALEIGPAGASFSRRFRYTELPLDRGSSPAAAISALIPLWREGLADALATRGDQPLVVPLSGGLDSRLLLATAVEAGARAEAFTFARTGERTPDMGIADEVCRTLGVPWRALGLDDDWLVDHAARASLLTDGQLDILHSYGISLTGSFPEGHLRLDGFAGDVVLGGSFLRREHLTAQSSEARHRLLWASRARLERAPWQELLVPEARGEMLDLARAALAQSLEAEPLDDPRWSDFWILRHRIRRFTVNGPLLWRSVARSVFPFFAPSFIDRLLAVAPEARLDAALQAPFFWQGFPRMAAIPWQRIGWPVPRGGVMEALLRRVRKPPYPPAQAFFDHDAVFRKSARLRTFLRDLLLDPRTGVDRFGCFDRASVARLLAGVEAGSRRGMPQISLLASLVLSERTWSPG
ncbi:asparagine synthase-related protein [Polyangium sp. 6x1]|uniref:asparagine synthase-related protein n=1 Tax=Polyangium sp. 6x1 TaxID=3042689 RepID=UPI0024829DE5|nr:asparagine synthase-related protein [Polyangium sp. 6x1]MDI1450702.1 asparagine synthase-related protein [Polyangium sp. 6x1]